MAAHTIARHMPDDWDANPCGVLAAPDRAIHEALTVIFQELRAARIAGDELAKSRMRRRLAGIEDRVHVLGLLTNAEPEQPASWIRHLEVRAVQSPALGNPPAEPFGEADLALGVE